MSRPTFRGRVGRSAHTTYSAAAATLRVLAALVLLTGLVRATPASADINAGLVAYYPFDGDVLDASGNGNHGTPFAVSFEPGALTTNMVMSFVVYDISRGGCQLVYRPVGSARP